MVCRSAFCLKCWQRDRPRKFDRFIVFGTDHQQFKTRVAHQDGLKGFTPHLYIIEFPYKKNEEGLIYVTKTCLMHTCGIEIGRLRDSGVHDLTFLEVAEHCLTELSVEALIKLWRGNTGYNIL